MVSSYASVEMMVNFSPICVNCLPCLVNNFMCLAGYKTTLRHYLGT